jgi:hypothetical protein
MWSSGYLPTKYTGVALRGQGDPVLYVKNPPGVNASDRRTMLDALNQLNHIQHDRIGDPEIQTRIAQYEMAFRMQSSVPELTDLAGESKATLEMYGADVHRSGSFTHSAIMARRLIERGTRVVQILHRGWDQHNSLPKLLRGQIQDTDQACAALVMDLKERGLLEDTLVVWGGEFGRTVYSQGTLTKDNYGRDHHPRNFCMWMAGGGVKGGTVYGETDDFSYNIVKDPVNINDLNATILHLMGIDHSRFSFKFQGLDQRLTGVEHARVRGHAVLRLDKGHVARGRHLAHRLAQAAPVARRGARGRGVHVGCGGGGGVASRATRARARARLRTPAQSQARTSLARLALVAGEARAQARGQ